MNLQSEVSAEMSSVVKTVKVNGTALPTVGNAVNVIVPTKPSDISAAADVDA